MNKATEYPIIYSYIYERESQDIRRLAGKFKGTKKTTTKSISAKGIIGFKIEDGKAIPIYSDKPTGNVLNTVNQKKSKVIAAKSGVVRRKTTTPKRRAQRDNPEEGK